MDVDVLEEIGFTNAEIKVYLSLLELGLSTAGPLIERSGLQSSVVHATLNKLISRGLVSFVKEGQRKHYEASNPNHITEYLQEKQEKYEEILPQLLAKQQVARNKSEVLSFRGVKGIKQLLYELLDAGGSEHLTFGSTEKSLMLGDSWWKAYHRRRAEKKIRARLLFNESLREWLSQNMYLDAEIRFTKKGFEPLTETIMRNDKVGIIIWSDEPLGVLIHQKEAAYSYAKFFEILWNS